MATIIDPALAESIIQEYRNQNSSATGPALKTDGGQLLNGYFIDRLSLDTILSNNKFVGLSVYLAKHPAAVGSPENIFTIVFYGAEANPNWVAGSTTTTPYINSGDPYDNTFPCPPFCGGK